MATLKHNEGGLSLADLLEDVLAAPEDDVLFSDNLVLLQSLGPTATSLSAQGGAGAGSIPADASSLDQLLRSVGDSQVFSATPMGLKLTYDSGSV